MKSESAPISNDDCTNPPESELKELLIEMYKKLNMTEQLANNVDFYHSGELHKEQIAKKSERILSVKYHGYRTCDINKQTKWQVNHNSICPHHFVEENRDDRYPFIRSRAVCNCDSCLVLPDSSFIKYGCQPIRIFEPVLVRGKCLSNGVYEWTLNYESVAIACGCDVPIKIS